jgi:(5-formylfuran-3-yl)methyl phosphate synthase
VRLLISVVDAIEACEAVAGGGDIIDVKDPSRGALGLAEPAVIRAVRSATPARLPVSAALGDGPFTPGEAARYAEAATRSGAAFVKLGLRQTSATAARAAIGAARAALPPAVAVVVAGFADARRADAPPPRELPGLARAAGAQGCLIDTAVKDGQGLFDWLDDETLAAFVADCRAAGLLAALAGSLQVADLPRLAAIGPDLVGFRGAACAGDRVRGRVDRARVRELRRALHPEALAPID